MAKDGTIPYLERDIMTTRDLLNRWIGATGEEIAIHNEKGELRAFKKYKGPIKGIVWCKPFKFSYIIGTTEIYEMPDYFLIADILACEKANPEYTGNINLVDLQMAKDATGHKTLQKNKYDDLQTEYQALQEKLAELQEETSNGNNEELKARLAELESREPCELPGLLAYFIDRRKEGLTDREIAEELIEKQGVPKQAIGAILRPEKEPIKDYRQWLDEKVLQKGRNK